jgi:hypothetical protein
MTENRRRFTFHVSRFTFHVSFRSLVGHFQYFMSSSRWFGVSLSAVCRLSDGALAVLG